VKTEQEKRDSFYIEPIREGEDAFHTHLRQSPEAVCLYPATHVNFKIDGAMSCCFRAANLGNIRDIGIEEFWNSEKFRTIRKNMVNGIKSPECNDCWKMESTGGFSYRKESISDLGVHAPWRDQFKNLREDGSMPFEVKQAELRFSNICNLQCRMCSPAYSSKWSTEMTKKSPLWNWLVSNNYYSDMEERMVSNHVPADKILDFIRKSAPHLEYLMITGGEPFIDTAHAEALKLLKPYAKNIVLEYTTNLNTLTKNGVNVLELWDDFKQIRLKVSIDGDPEIYNYVRYGGDIQAVMANVKKVYERFPIENKEPYKFFPSEKVVIVGTCTVSIYNVARLDRIANFITGLGAVFHTSQVNYPPFQSSQVLPAESKRKITENLSKFIDDVEGNIQWGDSPLWNTAAAREIQKRRVYRFIKNSIHHMNGADKHDALYGRFLEFEKQFNQHKDIPPEGFERFLTDSYLL
jgi:radical SAM protein with 4Fe4S-binding SPASM domain